jgi:hypothetical protein
MRRCPKCKLEKEIDSFCKNKRKKSGYSSWCKDCNKIYLITWQISNKEKLMLDKKNWYIKNKDRILENSIIKKFGLSFEDRNKKIKLQKNKCAICKNIFSKTPHIDHNHKTGKIRELLCGFCNKGLGEFKDNVVFLKNAIIYLEKHK